MHTKGMASTPAAAGEGSGASSSDPAQLEKAATTLQAATRGRSARKSLVGKVTGSVKSLGGAAAGSLKRAGTTTINTVTPLAPKAVVQAAKGVKDAVKDVKDDIEGLVVELTPAQAAEVAAATKALAVGAGAFTRKVFTNPKQAATEISTLLGDAGKGTAAALSLIQALGASNGGLESVLQVCESLAESASKRKRAAFVGLLRTSLDVSLGLVRAAIRRPALIERLRKVVDSQLADIHLGGGIQLDESGVFSNYYLEVLRHNRTESQAMRAVPVHKKGKTIGFTYELVRKSNLSEPSQANDMALTPEDVKSYGFLRSLNIQLEGEQVDMPSPSSSESPPSFQLKAIQPPGEVKKQSTLGKITAAPLAAAGGLGKGLKGLTGGKKASPTGKGSPTLTGKDSPTPSDDLKDAHASVIKTVADSSMINDPKDQVEAHLKKRYLCMGGPLSRCLPVAALAQFPFDVPDDWMPAELREHAEEVVAFKHYCEIVLVFDAESGSAMLEVPMAATPRGGDATPRGTPRNLMRMGTLAAPKTPRETVRFQLQLTGVGCWPTLGQLTVRSITFKAEVMLWWEVFEQRVHLAFLRHADDTSVHGKTSFSWDVDLSLFGCGLPLPAAIEDRMISGLVTTIMRSYNQMNPLVIDLRELLDGEGGGKEQYAASSIQAQWRGKVQRDKSEMKSALNAAKGSAKLEDQMVSMEAEMKALRNMVASLEKELAAAKRRPPQ